MKRYLQVLLVLIFACFSNSIFSQLTNGSIAPDWTMTDINGVTYNLYDELDAGKSILLDISATWCGPCWTYHNNGTMESLYEDYGPDGTDQIRVFMVEGEPDTNLNCLYGSSGCNDSSWGDWVTGTPYPIFSPEPSAANSFLSDYQLGFWPTLYAISPLDKTTRYMGLASYGSWESWLIDSYQMSATYTSVDSDCPYTGAADITVELGFGNLNYEWSNGATTEDLLDVPAGNYSVSITDGHNVQLVLDDITIGGTTAQVLDVDYLSIEEIDCNGQSTGSIDVLASGGAGSFTYNWDNGQAGSYIDNLFGGDYEVTATDIEGCQVVKLFTVGEPEVLSMGISAVNTACGGNNGSAILFADGGVGPYSYDIGMGVQNSSSFNSLDGGTYVAEIMDVNGCLTQEVFTIAESVAPVAIAEVSGALDCNTVNVSLSAANSTASGNLTYAWSTSDGEIIGNDQAETIMTSVAGLYSLQVVELGTGCESNTEIEVEENSSSPLISLADVDMITCLNTQVIIDGSMSEAGANLLYAWTTQDGSIIGDADDLTLEVDKGGTYTLTVSDGDNGCVSSESITVDSDISLPTIEVNNGALTCDVAEVEICASVDAGHIVRWNTDNGIIMQSCIIVSVSGDFEAIVEGPNGCTSSAISTVTQSIEVPEVSLASPSIITCTQESVLLTAQIEGGAADNTIIWTNETDIVINEGSTELEVSNAGMYQIMVTNANGCSASQQVIVEENINTPIAGFDYSVDQDGVVVVQSTSAAGGSVTWQLEDGTSLSGEEATFSLAQGGEYEVCMTYANECGSDINCNTIVYSVLLAVNIDKSDLTCYQSEDGSISPSVSGGSSSYSYLWIGPEQFVSSEANLTGLSAGTYTLTINDDGGMEIVTEVLISEPLELRSMNETVTNVNCNGDFDGGVSLNMTGGTGSYMFQWSDGSTEAIRVDLSAGDYNILVTDENGCEFNSSYVITEPEVITLTDVLITEETDGQADGSISIEVSGGTGELMYLWSNGATTATIDNLSSGEYAVVVTDANGCTYSEEGIEVSSLTDITDLSIVTNFNMYPIPAHSFLNVKATLNGIQKIKINIVDAQGRPIWSTSNSTSEIKELIDLSDLATGIYSLSVVTENSIQSENFIVIK